MEKHMNQNLWFNDFKPHSDQRDFSMPEWNSGYLTLGGSVITAPLLMGGGGGGGSEDAVKEWRVFAV